MTLRCASEKKILPGIEVRVTPPGVSYQNSIDLSSLTQMRKSCVTSFKVRGCNLLDQLFQKIAGNGIS